MSSVNVNSEGQAQQLHALGRATSATLSKQLGRSQRALVGAGSRMRDAKVEYAQAADAYRAAWSAARAMFTEEQLTELGFPNLPAPRRASPDSTSSLK